MKPVQPQDGCTLSFTGTLLAVVLLGCLSILSERCRRLDEELANS